MDTAQATGAAPAERPHENVIEVERNSRGFTWRVAVRRDDPQRLRQAGENAVDDVMAVIAYAREQEAKAGL